MAVDVQRPCRNWEVFGASIVEWKCRLAVGSMGTVVTKRKFNGDYLVS